MENSKRMVNVLWTGGWDSSYRIVELSRMDITLQPIYVYGEGRSSEKYELKAMQDILRKIDKKNETIAEILPIDFIRFDNIKLNNDISKAYNSIAEEIHLGSQYEWLPCLAFKYENLEIGIEKAPPEQSGAINAIKNYGKMQYDRKQDTYLLDVNNSTKSLKLLFQNLSFPIINKTGEDMKNNILQWGYEEVMENAWMCFTPIFGKPCGTCNPCKSKMETNMEFMLASSSKRRYNNRNKKLSRYKDIILKKISFYIDKIRFREYSV